MDNLPFLHSDGHQGSNEDGTKKNGDGNGFGNGGDFLNDIIHSTPDLIYLIDLYSGNIIYINKIAEDLFGYDADQIYTTGVNFLLELVHADDKEQRDVVLKMAVDGAVIESEIRMKVKDGSYHLFRMRDRIIKKDTGNPVWQTIGSGTDISMQISDGHNFGQLKGLFAASKTAFMVLHPIKDGDGSIKDFKVTHGHFADGFFEKPISLHSLDSDNFPDGKKDGHFDRYVDTLNTKTTQNFDEFYLAKNAGGKWYNQTVVALENGDLAITFQDGTERKKSEAALDEQSKLVQGIANSTPDILFVLNLETKSIIYANKQIANVLGYTNKQILGMKHTIFDLVYEDDKAALLQHLDDMQTAADGEIREIEYRMRAADGSLHWYIDRNTVFKRDNNGKPSEKIGIAQDITLRKKQAEEISLHLKILKQSEELAQIGSWNYDIASKGFSWSDGMYTLFAIEKGVPVRPSVYLTYVLEKDRQLAEKIVTSIQNTYEPFTETIRLKVGNEIKTVTIKSGDHKNEKGDKISMFGVDMDISTTVSNEMQIKELNHNLQIINRGLESANTDLKAFNTLAATNYRQTLQKLYTSMEYLVTHDARNLTNEGRANIRRAQSAIQKMKLMTEDMINLSKLHTLDTQLAEVNLSETIAEVITKMQDKINEAKAIINYAKMPVIQGYSTLISLLFHHLLDNAIKFRRPDVTPTVGIASKTDKINNISYYVITVTDNGIGFEQEIAQEVFTMFYRQNETAYKGSGIGLAVCKKIMDIHDGFITANSIVNTETIFSCYFPVAQTLK